MRGIGDPLSNARRACVRALGGALVAAIAGLGCLAPAVLASGTVNIVGTWQISGAGCAAGTTPAGVQTWVVKSENAGTFTGTGSGAGYTWTLANGKITGSSFTMSTTYAGYTATERGTISADGKHMSGTFTDTYGRTNGCFSGVRTSAPKPKKKPAKSPKKKNSKKGSAVSCVVPSLAGKTLSAAKAALKKAHCGLGRVSQPKAEQHHTLHVRSQSPKPGKHLKANSKVAVTLK